MNTYLSDEQIYEWLRDEFKAGHCPRWFGDSFSLVVAIVRHAEVLEKKLAEAEDKLKFLQDHEEKR